MTANVNDVGLKLLLSVSLMLQNLHPYVITRSFEITVFELAVRTLSVVTNHSR